MTLLFFDFGSSEILLILLVVFLIFGPDKIPEIARNIGKVINDVKRASEDIKTEISREGDRKDREKRLAEYEAKIAMTEKETPADSVGENEEVVKDKNQND